MYNRFPRDVQDFLASYKGPYPLHQLKMARDTLVYGFNTYNSRTFHRIYQLMCMESYTNNFNPEYSEDNYTESESDNESKLIFNTKIKFNDEPSGAGSEVKTKQESEVKTKQESEVKTKQESEVKTKQESEVKIKQESEVKTKQESEVKTKQESEVKTKQESEVKTKQESEVKTTGEPLKCVAESQNTGVNDKPFCSTEGFKNRFAEYLYGKTTVDIFNGDEENTLKRKLPDDIKTNGSDVESHKRPVANEDFIKLDCSPSPKKVAKTSLDSIFNDDTCVECFKCDYCEFTSLKTEEMFSHLNSLKHRSGSKCLGQMENGNVYAWYTVEQLFVKNDQNGFTLIATCPNCFRIFPNIYDCATHSKTCISPTDQQQYGRYAISEVVRNTEILVPVDSVCQVCKLRCARHRALNVHYEAKKHYPFEEPESPDTLLSFLCPFCEKDFDHFFTAKAHVISHAVKFPRVSMALQLFYYKKTSVGKQLLPVRHSLPKKKFKKARGKKPFYRYFGKFSRKTKTVGISNNNNNN